MPVLSGLGVNPSRGSVGEEGEYPVDVRLPPPAQQDRLKTLVRIFLAIPSLLVSATLGGGGSVRIPYRGSYGRYGGRANRALAGVCSVLGWVAVLALRRMH